MRRNILIELESGIEAERERDRLKRLELHLDY